MGLVFTTIGEPNSPCGKSLWVIYERTFDKGNLGRRSELPLIGGNPGYERKGILAPRFFLILGLSLL